MSVNIATEVRRISDARSRLKSIIDLQAQNQARSISPDNLKFQTNATMVQSTKVVSDQVELAFQCAKPANEILTPQAPLEPDLSTLTCWMPFDNLGKQSDLALMGNTGKARGCCWLDPGPPDNGNRLIGGTRAIRFDGYTSFVDVPDIAEWSNLKMGPPGYSIAGNANANVGGFSFCCRMFSQDYKPQADFDALSWRRRTIAAKMDDANNAWMLMLNSENGDLVFHVRRAGTMRKVKFTGMQKKWYDVVVTFSNATNALTIYRDALASTTADTTPEQIGGIPNDWDLHISRANKQLIVGDANEYGVGAGFDAVSYDGQSFGTTAFQDAPFNTVPWSTVSGAFMGLLYDIRFYQRVLTQAEVTNLYQNKFSISSIAVGQSANAGYCLAHS